MVLPVGFEPNITGLRGQPPNQLEDGSIWQGIRVSEYLWPTVHDSAVSRYTTCVHQAPHKNRPWCCETGLNRRHHDYQSCALPTELPQQIIMAGVEGLEPSPTALETDMLPITPNPYGVADGIRIRDLRSHNPTL